MLTNVEKLTRLKIIGHVRQRLGASDENDTSLDSRINKISETAFVAGWTAWYVGGDWLALMESYYDELEKLSK